MIVGLTGNIGSGKSIVAKIFSTLGVSVYNADNNAKKFLDNSEVKVLVKNNFGVNVFDKNNKIDRKTLADIVFNNPDKLIKLNSIIHPFVMKDFNNWVHKLKLDFENLTLENQASGFRHPDSNYVIIEAAILFESGYNSIADKTIVVTCPEELRINRIMSRDRSTEAEVRQRINNQWSEKQKTKLADFIIVNDELHLITPQVIEINRQLNLSV